MLNDQLMPYEIEYIVQDEVTNILRDNNINKEIFSETKLNAELGMTSLELARLVSILDDKLKVDPFIELVPITSVRTVGDLVCAYQKAIHSI